MGRTAGLGRALGKGSCRGRTRLSAHRRLGVTTIKLVKRAASIGGLAELDQGFREFYHGIGCPETEEVEHQVQAAHGEQKAHD